MRIFRSGEWIRNRNLETTSNPLLENCHCVVAAECRFVVSIRERTSGSPYTIKLKTPVRDINIDVCFQQGNQLNDGKKGCENVLITHNIIAVIIILVKMKVTIQILLLLLLYPIRSNSAIQLLFLAINLLRTVKGKFTFTRIYIYTSALYTSAIGRTLIVIFYEYSDFNDKTWENNKKFSQTLKC